MKYLIRFFFLLLGSTSALLAQMPDPVMNSIEASMPKPVPASPNSSALGKFGSYEVSHYTGLPEISIPIFEVKSGALSIPITLSYHASGIRVLDVATWVGLGWSLSTGGQISRQTRGEPDELGYFTHPLIENPEICGPSANWDYVRNAATEVIDTQPDIFSYTFGSKNGNFILGHLGEAPFLFPYEPIQIEHGLTSNGDLRKFIVNDEDGTLYTFGENTAGPGYEGTTVDRSPFYPLTSTTSWLLTKVASPNGNDEIGISYQSLGYSLTYEPRTSITVLDGCVGEECPQDGPQTALVGYNNVTSHQSGVKEILFEGGKVEFVLTAPRLDQGNLQALDTIKIYQEVGGVYTLFKSVKFIYSYFTYNSDPNVDVKLKLDTLQFITSDGKVDNQYTFKYFTDGFSWNEGNQYSKDFWGYYNGKLNNDLIPTQQVEWTPNNQGFQVTSQVGSADRSTVTEYMLEGVLKKITYPTGGYTEFAFEPHMFTEDGVTQYAPGLRIDTIKSYDGVSPNPVIKAYTYGEAGAGIKNFYNSLLYYKSESMVYSICCLFDETCVGNTTYRQRTFFGNSLIEIGSQEGSPVVYPTVTEHYVGDTSTIGSIVYQYDNGEYIKDSLQIILGPHSGKNFKSSYKWKRGKLTKKSTFDTANKLVSETVIGYTLFQKQKKHIGTAAEVFKDYIKYNICVGDCNNEYGDPIDDDQYLYGTYYQMSGALRQASLVETLYEDGDLDKPIVISTATSFDPVYLQPLDHSSTSSVSNQVSVKKLLYPFSYTYPGSETGVPNGLRKLYDKHILNVPIEEYVIKQNTDGSNLRVVHGRITTYVENENNVDQAVPDEVFVFESALAVPLSDYTISSVSGSSSFSMDSRYNKRLQFKSYDLNANITTFAKADDKCTSYLWGYRETLPIAQVENADFDYQPDTEVIYDYGSSFSENFTVDRALTPSLVIEKGQTVTYSLSFFQTGGTTPTTPPWLDVVLKGSDGAIVYDPGVYEIGMYNATITLTSGTYTLWYHGSSNGDATNNVTVRFDVTINYFDQTYHPNLFHTSFEEGGTEYPQARTGSKVHSGSYEVRNPTATGNYVLSWWHKTGSNPWEFAQLDLSGGGGKITIGSLNSYIDEVRLYPKDATVTTYTYDPLSGITSQTDPNNITTHYGYDKLGRLEWVKDNEGNLLKSFEYHYKGQQ